MPMPKALVATITGQRSSYWKSSWFCRRSSSERPAWYRVAGMPCSRSASQSRSTAARVAQ